MGHAALARIADAAAAPLPAGAPHRIGRVALVVNDLSLMTGFYRSALGLEPVGGEPGQLGAGGTVLLTLTEDQDARRPGRNEAGLFHTAFLLPGRAELGAWLAQAGETGVTLDGAADHRVSEALYLTDPEGNGIEIYADRPSRDWTGADGTIAMTTEPLDLEALAASAGPWSGFPAGGTIGHVHLQVGDLDAAEAFYGVLLGFEVTARSPGALFFGSGGYHHQLAANAWNSRGAPARSGRTTGLAEIEILADPLVVADAHRRLSPGTGPAPDGVRLRDPWGTWITLRSA